MTQKPASPPLPSRQAAPNRTALMALTVALGLGTQLPVKVQAATDIATTPLTAQTRAAVHPNVLFILGDSDTMNRDYWPETVPDNAEGYARKSAQCNALAYDPQLRYTPPTQQDGQPLAPADFPRVRSDGYDPSSAKVDLFAAPHNIYYTYTGSQDRLGYASAGPGDQGSTNRFYLECSNHDTASRLFTPVEIQREPPAQQQNYANWFSYYRTRLLMAKTAMGQAVLGVDARVRLGFTVSNNHSADPSQLHSPSGTHFLDPVEFGATAANSATSAPPIAPSAPSQRLAFYTNLYRSRATAHAPLRGTLSLAGQYHANKARGQSKDPVEYACQRNFALLLSDSAWSTEGESTTPPKFGPYQLDNSTPIADLDGDGATTPADVRLYAYTTDLRDPLLANCTGARGTDVCRNQVVGSDADMASHQHLTSILLGLGSSGAQTWITPDSLKAALQSTQSLTLSGTAPTLGPPQVPGAQRTLYAARFTTVLWHGDVLAYDYVAGAEIDLKKPHWSAQKELDAAEPAARSLYYAKSGTLHAFTYANLAADALQAHFDHFCSKPGLGGATMPSQCAQANIATRTLANNGAHLVDYLRGSNTHGTDTIFRRRAHRLGDIANAAPLYVGAAPFAYGDPGYAAYRASQREAMVLAAANDGMLHAFSAASGAELWAFIPSLALPRLYLRADTGLADHPAPLVDGTPVAGDVFAQGSWKTMVVGGLNGGGRGYYALDITSPRSPKLLWEFSEPDLGYTFGNPLITKLANGSWVVVFASGYNNTRPGDGNGHLYVLDAYSGALLQKIDTLLDGSPVGTASHPSGLAAINNYVESEADNTSQAVYGGDLLGNVWRFEINPQPAPHPPGTRMALLTFQGQVQPVTARPALASLRYQGVPYRVVYVGTGQWLGLSDLTNTSVQSLYAIKDAGNPVGLGDIRAARRPALVKRAAAGSPESNASTESAPAVDWARDLGWVLDLPGRGERVTAKPSLLQDTLYASTQMPSADACALGGDARLYRLDPASGAPRDPSASDTTLVSEGVLATGLTPIQSASRHLALVLSRSDTGLQTLQPTAATPSRRRHRTAWRTLP